MWIRFRASYFGLVSKIKNHSFKSKQVSRAEMVLGSFVFFPICTCDSAARFWTQKIQANVDYCYIRRRAECTSLGPGLNQASKPTLRLQSGCEETCRGASRVFFSTLCVLSHDRYRSHEMRALGATFSLFSRSEPASTDS